MGGVRTPHLMSAAGEDIRIELRGLEAVGPHGVTAEEREAGCRIALDISLTVSGSAAVTTDELEDTVDYGAVARLAVELVEGRSCHTIERLAALIADEITARFPVAAIEVRVAKPQVPMAQTIDEVAVTVRRGPGLRS